MPTIDMESFNVTWTPDGDASVFSNKPYVNYDEDWLKVRGSLWYSLLRFKQSSSRVEFITSGDRVNHYTLSVKFIHLKLYTYRDIDETTVYSFNSSGWVEDEVRYVDLPDDIITTAVGSRQGDIYAGEWVTFNLDPETTVLPTREGKKASFSLSSTEANANEAYYSGDYSDADYGPQLIVGYRLERHAAPTATPTISGDPSPVPLPAPTRVPVPSPTPQPSTPSPSPKPTLSPTLSPSTPSPSTMPTGCVASSSKCGGSGWTGNTHCCESDESCFVKSGELLIMKQRNNRVIRICCCHLVEFR